MDMYTLPTFLLTRPSRDVTFFDPATNRLNNISTHTSLAGRDPLSPHHYLPQLLFLLTRPSRDVTCSPGHKLLQFQFLLTRPSRDVTWDNLDTAWAIAVFLLTRPSRDVTEISLSGVTYDADFYSHVPRGT